MTDWCCHPADSLGMRLVAS